MKKVKGNTLILIGFIILFLLMCYLVIFKLSYDEYHAYVLSRYYSNQTFDASYQLIYNLNQSKIVELMLIFNVFLIILRSLQVNCEAYPNLNCDLKKGIKILLLYFLIFIIYYLLLINFLNIKMIGIGEIVFICFLIVVMSLLMSLTYRKLTHNVDKRIRLLKKSPESLNPKEYEIPQRTRFNLFYYSLLSLVMIILISVLTVSSNKINRGLTIPNKMLITQDFTLDDHPLFERNNTFYLDSYYQPFFNHYELSQIKLGIDDQTFVNQLLDGEITISIDYRNNDYLIPKDNLTYSNHYLIINFDKIEKFKPEDEKLSFSLYFNIGNLGFNREINQYQILLLKK